MRSHSLRGAGGATPPLKPEPAEWARLDLRTVASLRAWGRRKHDKLDVDLIASTVRCAFGPYLRQIRNLRV